MIDSISSFHSICLSLDGFNKCERVKFICNKTIESISKNVYPTINWEEDKQIIEKAKKGFLDFQLKEELKLKKMIDEISNESNLAEKYFKILKSKKLKGMIQPLEQTLYKFKSFQNSNKKNSISAMNDMDDTNNTTYLKTESFIPGMSAKSYIKKKKKTYLKKIADIEL